jgi:hypothetical protein
MAAPAADEEMDIYRRTGSGGHARSAAIGRISGRQMRVPQKIAAAQEQCARRARISG